MERGGQRMERGGGGGGGEREMHISMCAMSLYSVCKPCVEMLCFGNANTLSCQ